MTVASKVFLTLSLTLISIDAHAFYAQTDTTEVYTILPDETAIWILDKVDKVDNQVEANSLAYLQAHKIFLRDAPIPHSKLWGSNGKSMFSGRDYFVPDGRLIIVSRRPAAVEWRNGNTTGIDCTTKDGLAVSVGVSIVASITEQQAAEYLYYFGLEIPEGDPNDESAPFRSVYRARALESVLSSFGHAFLRAAICRQFHARKLDEANSQAGAMMEAVAKEVYQTFSQFGVTVSNIGWADNFRFAPEVQSSINRVYASNQEVSALNTINILFNSLQHLSGIGMIREFGLKTKGALPRTLVGP